MFCSKVFRVPGFTFRVTAKAQSRGRASGDRSQTYARYFPISKIRKGLCPPQWLGIVRSNDSMNCWKTPGGATPPSDGQDFPVQSSAACGSRTELLDLPAAEGKPPSLP
ncbi:MAG: hypothetical protein WAX69_22230 [Victivallales bacterium]